ncbi:hypothetical protein XELAEV_18012310mg [Xenopus laevis]|uniref:Uncharacterized protein n=1 Tax=Xenopus laevis TaxID=8355 RepID=A0A974DMV4_XENLA|nr:hypothetical protein XELAEV_18012310mg [Xenopus laevis]
MLKKKELQLHSHCVSLSEYYKQRLIPRGFRIFKTPTTGRDDKEFCQKWCAILNKASLDLMVLVIEHTSNNLSKTRMEILKTELEFDKVSNQEERDTFNAQLSQKLDEWRNDLLAFKKKMLLKVMQDYKTDNIYRWSKDTGDSDSPGHKTFLSKGAKGKPRKKQVGDRTSQKEGTGEQTNQENLQKTQSSPPAPQCVLFLIACEVNRGGAYGTRRRLTGWTVAAYKRKRGSLPALAVNTEKLKKQAAGSDQEAAAEEEFIVPHLYQSESTLAQLRKLTLPLCATSDFSEFAERWRNYAWRSAAKCGEVVKVVVNLPHRV